MRASVARLSQRLANMDSLPPREKWRKHPLLNPSFLQCVPRARFWGRACGGGRARMAGGGGGGGCCC